jgi:hypothetical protein
MNRTYTILMPVYNDWDAVAKLLRNLDREVAAAGHRPSVLLVNDGSTRPYPPSNLGFDRLDSVASAAMLCLGTNLGHQRAIAIGIAHLAAVGPVGDVIVMDSDGEDDPADVPRLIAAADALAEPQLVLALRAKRSETMLFRIFYTMYMVLFRLLTGTGIRFGNFGFIPAAFLPRLARMPEVWNHYAGSVVKSRLPRTSIATTRASRLDGSSSMNFVGLVLHGLSAISVFNDVVGVRLLCIALGFATTCLLLIVGIFGVRFLTSWAIPGWATTAVGIATLLFTNALLLAVSFVFFTLSNRTTNCFVPARDYQAFVEGVVTCKKGVA